MFRNRLPFLGFVSRAGFFAVIAVFVFIFLAAGNSFAELPGDQDISENIWASALAPAFDYGIFSERFIEVRVKPTPRGMSPMQTPPPAEEEEQESFDPKPHKPPERPGVPVDPSFLDQPLACTAPVVNASATSGNEDESFMAVNPTNPQNIVVFSNLNANSIHRSYTTNGGTSWTHGTVVTNAACCDAQAAWDSFGNLFMVYINSSVNQINVVLSTDGGVTFGAPVTAGTGSVDQPSIAVGNGTVWVDWNLSGSMVAKGAPVTGLGSWGPFPGTTQTIPSATGSYGGIAVGPSGKVIVTYQNPTGGQGPATIYTNTDADGLGAGGFGARVTVTTTNVGGFDFIPAQSGRSIDAEPGVVWDATGGVFNNRIYLVYTEEVVAESNDTDILIRTSTDDGATWSAPVRVNDDATTRSQFLPYISLDRTTGAVAVVFHDSRNDNGTVGTGGTNTTANDDAEYFATYSTNGGTTWAANTRISGGWSNALAAGASTDYGDYEGQAAQSGKLYAIWADNSNCDGTNPNGTAHQFDLYMGTLTIPGGATPTATSTPTITPTFTPSNTPTRTSTSTPTSTATTTNTPTSTATRTSTNTPTNTATAANTPTSTATHTATNTATSTPTATPLTVTLPAVSAAPGTEVTIPITVSDTTGLQITSYDLQITFDPAVVQPSATSFDTAGTLSSAMSITPNTNNSGHFIISAFQGTFLAGPGTLINLKFTVVGNSGQSTALTFEDYTDPASILHPGFQFNEGVPSSATTNGSITVAGSAMSGTVTYANAIGAPTPRFVSNVTISAAGSPTVITTTGAPGPTEGQYILNGLGSGAYTVTPSKTGGVNGAINSFDAGRIAQHVAGITFLTGNALTVADVSGNGTVSSFDAAEIANFVVSGTPIGQTGTWKFNPVNRSYASVPSNLAGQDYLALLMGEVSGNWTNTGARAVVSSQLAVGSSSESDVTSSIAVAAPGLVTPADNEVLIPIGVERVAKKGVIAYEFDLRYDPTVIQPQANPVDVAGTISRGLTAIAKSDEAGLLRVAVYGPIALNGDGLLLNLKFTAVGAPGSVSPLTWERIMFNEGDSETLTAAGQVELSASAPDQAEISGRVLTGTGVGVPNARVTMTDTTGETRTAVSNGFGYYRFGDLKIGQTYTFQVESRIGKFTPVTVSLTDQLMSVDLIAGE